MFDMFVTIVLVTTYLSTVNCQRFKRENSGVSYANFVRNPFSKLNESSLATIQVSSLGECALECIDHRECFSVNLGNQNRGKDACELIKTDKFKKPDMFTVSQKFHHYYIKVRS